MKTKFIFVLLLFSFLLNIGHDLVMATTQIDKCNSVSIVQLESQELECCKDMVDFHEHFHFTAMAIDDIGFSPVIKRKVQFYTTSMFSYITKDSSFKPPRV